nr:HAMP domain-containing methyl-accepting chemotaxis protein [Bacillus massiliigorillae]
MSFKYRSLLSFGSIFVLILILGIIQYVNSEKQINDLETIRNATLQSSLITDELKLSVVQVQQYFSDISATRAQDGYDDGFEKAEDHSKIFYNDLEKLKELHPTESNNLNEIKSSFDSYYATGKKMATYYIQEGPSKGNTIMPEFDATAIEINDKVDKLQQKYISDINYSLKNNEDLINKSQLVFIIIAALVFIIGIVIAVLLSKSIINPLTKLIESSKIITKGDLSHSALIDSKDEFGRLSHSFEEMRLSLSNLIQQLNTTTQQIVSSSEELSVSTETTKEATEQITNSIQEVAVGTDLQASDLSATSNSISEISQGMNQAALSIERVTNLGIQATDSVNNGNKIVQQTLDQMNNINYKVNHTSATVNRLADTSEEIGQIISLITQIADKTNLLALNAAIEAARAGEHGRGFAVVADEVRKLAEQSSQSAKDIQILIEQIQLEAKDAANSMADGESALKDGIEMTFNTGKAFKNISEFIEQISIQTIDVSTVIMQVNTNTNSMVDIIERLASISEKSVVNTQNVASATEEQYASMQELATSSENLNNIATNLQSSINKFIL